MLVLGGRSGVVVVVVGLDRDGQKNLLLLAAGYELGTVM